MKLHLGCGDKYKDDWVNVDMAGDVADQLVDLSQFPWPWADATVDQVYLEHVIEHFERPEFLLKEIHRILKPGGVVDVITPHKESVAANVPDHKSFFAYCFFNNFTRPDWYWIKQNADCWFKEIFYRVVIIKQPFCTWSPFDWIASKFPFFWEKVAFGIFRPTEIHWCAQKPPVE